MSDEEADDTNRESAPAITQRVPGLSADSNILERLELNLTELREQDPLRRRIGRIPSAVQRSVASTQRGVAAKFGTALGRDEQAQYIAAVVAVNADLDRPIRAADIETETEYSVSTVTDPFGGWQATLEAAGIDRRAQIQTEIRRLERELGHQPFPSEMNEHGHVSATAVQNTFESYEHALNATASLAEEIPNQTGPVHRLSQVIPFGVFTANNQSGKEPGLAGYQQIASPVQSVRRVVDRSGTGFGSGDQTRSVRNTVVRRLRWANPTAKLAAWWVTFSGGVRSLSPTKTAVTQINHERRNVLKYAGVSAAIAVGVSSGEELTTAGSSLIRQRYGYGGAPIDEAKPSINSSETETQTETVESPITESETERETLTETVKTPITESETEQETSTPTSTESSTEATDNDGWGSTGSTGGGGGGGGGGSGGGGSTGSESTPTETPTPTESDRYASDLDDVSKGYGEQGYGGTTAS